MIPKEILKKVQHIQIRSRHRVNDVFAGQYHSVFKGQGIEFHEVREYVPGDDIRSIDWNVTARMNHPFVKKYIEEREMTVMLLVDVSASHQFGSTEQLKKDLAAEIAAVLAFSAIRNNDRVGLILFSDQVEHYIPPDKGTRHVLRVIREVLYGKSEHTGTDLRPALDFMNQVTHRKSTVFLISDFIFPDPCARHMAITSKRHDLISIIIRDRRERAWPSAGLVEWEDAETGRRFLLDTSDPATRRRLEAYQIHQSTLLNEQLRGRGVDTIEVFAGEPYEKDFMKFFRMRQQRQRA